MTSSILDKCRCTHAIGSHTGGSGRCTASVWCPCTRFARPFFEPIGDELRQDEPKRRHRKAPSRPADYPRK